MSAVAGWAVAFLLSNACFLLWLVARGHKARWTAEVRRHEQTAQLLDAARHRNYLALGALADLLGRNTIPDVPAPAGSLGDQVEAWLASTAEDQ
jgi:hypothetical protein